MPPPHTHTRSSLYVKGDYEKKHARNVLIWRDVCSVSGAIDLCCIYAIAIITYYICILSSLAIRHPYNNFNFKMHPSMKNRFQYISGLWCGGCRSAVNGDCTCLCHQEIKKDQKVNNTLCLLQNKHLN